ncbi:MAG: hypothetical protein CG439_1086 [Methylococcaceae bacterium NSP1-2]|nr:MAG: hypothetical protein CG439_1086 [Methylococcaceae bacterium NSP1-2]
MRCATLSTRPFSYSQTCSTFRTTGTNTATARAGLDSVIFVDFYKYALRRYRLVFKTTIKLFSLAWLHGLQFTVL